MLVKSSQASVIGQTTTLLSKEPSRSSRLKMLSASKNANLFIFSAQSML
jgi:hypothetical protein